MVAEDKAREISALSWEGLDAYGSREETIVAASGRTLRIRSRAFWDMDDWASDVLVVVKVYPSRGWRRLRPYKAVAIRGGETLPPRSVKK